VSTVTGTVDTCQTAAIFVVNAQAAQQQLTEVSQQQSQHNIQSITGATPPNLYNSTQRIYKEMKRALTAQ
jgi:hypothetical protein